MAGAYFKYGDSVKAIPNIYDVWPSDPDYVYAMISEEEYNPGKHAYYFRVSAHGFHRKTGSEWVSCKNYLGSSMNKLQTVDGRYSKYWGINDDYADWSSSGSSPHGQTDIPGGAKVVWSNHDIVNQADGSVYFAANTDDIFQVTADTPVFTQNLPLFGEVIYEQGDSADALSVEAVVSDGGTLTYQWYWSGMDVAPLIEGATKASYTPSTDLVVTRFYHCMVTNTVRSGLTAFAISNSIKVTTLSNGSGTGGGDSDDTEISEKAKALQGAFMVGLSAGITMYRATVLIGDTGTNAVVASGNGATSNEIQTAFRAGFASGVAMYGAAIDRNPIFAVQDGETLTMQGAYSVVQNGKVLEVT